MELYVTTNLSGSVTLEVNSIGSQGIQGVSGSVGIGIPIGGTDGQILAKSGSGAYEAIWVNPADAGQALVSGDNISELVNNVGYLTSSVQPGDNVSILTNDSGYLTSSVQPNDNISVLTNDSGYLTSADTGSVLYTGDNVSDLVNDADYLQTGSNISLLTNDAGFLTGADVSGSVINVNGQSGSVTLDADDIDDSATTNKWTTAAKLSQIDSNATDIANLSGSVDVHLFDLANPHQVTQTQVGLSNVDNTSDIDKPVSTATSASIALEISGLDPIPSGTVSGSSQVSYPELSNIPSGIISGSTQITDGSTILSGSKTDITELNAFTSSIQTEVNGLSSATGSYVTLTGVQTVSDKTFNNIHHVGFDTASAVTPNVGQLEWNANDGTLNLGLLGGNVVLQVGQETHAYVKASEAITDGDVVYTSGAVGASGKLLITKFIADGSITDVRILGTATEAIASGNFGYITVFGTVNGIKTDYTGTGDWGTTWLEGDELFASATVAGGLTNVKPTKPLHAIRVAIVAAVHAVNGVIFVRPTIGEQLNNLHDVELTVLSEGEILTYVSSSAVFTNKNIRTVLPSGTVSGSSQVSYNGITDVPANIVSGSDQVSGSFVLKSGDTISGNLTITGDLTVDGTTTSVNTDELNVGDNIINLNYGGSATEGGIQVRDVTGASLLSGSLLWNGTNDEWVAGTIGNESKVLVANGDGVVSGSSQISYTAITDVPSGIVSGSSQITITESQISDLTHTDISPLNTFTSSIQSEVDGLSAQTGSYLTSSGSVDYTDVTNKPTLVSGSSQVDYTGLSNIPSGIVSGSSQLNSSFVRKDGTEPLTADWDAGEFDISHKYSPLYKETVSTGILSGGALSINGGNTSLFDLASGSGAIVDHTVSPPTVTKVTWAAQTGVTLTNLATSFATDIAIDITGNIVQQNSFSFEELRSVILLGGLDHSNQTNILDVFSIQKPLNSPASNVAELANALGDINLSGNIYAANAAANLTIDRSAGTVYSYGRNNVNNQNAPSTLTSSTETVVSFGKVFNNGSGVGTFTVPATNIDPNFYDNGSGTLVAVTANNWSIQRILFFPNADKTFIQYGTEIFSKLQTAIDALTTTNFVELAGIRTAQTRGYLIVQEGETDLTSNNTLFVNANRFGFVGGVSGGTAGAVAWGSITGTLSNQIDLQSALNNKANLVGSSITGSFTGSFVGDGSQLTGLPAGGGDAVLSGGNNFTGNLR